MTNPALNDRLRRLIKMGADVGVPTPRAVLKWTIAAWEERLAVAELYGRDGLRRLVAGDPAAFQTPLKKHLELTTLLHTELAPATKPDAVKIILSRPVVLTYPITLIKRSIKQAVVKMGSPAALWLFQGNPDLLFKADDLEAATGGQVRTSAKGRARVEPSLRNAAVLGISEEQFRRLVANTGTGLPAYEPELIEARIQGLMRLLNCPREVATAGAVMKPSIITSDTATVAAKVKAIRAAIARSKNSAWHAWGSEPPTSASVVRAWAAKSLKSIERLDYLVRTGKDVGAPPPGAILDMSDAKFQQRFGKP